LYLLKIDQILVLRRKPTRSRMKESGWRGVNAGVDGVNRSVECTGYVDPRTITREGAGERGSWMQCRGSDRVLSVDGTGGVGI
jgi:hypothetical protein